VELQSDLLLATELADYLVRKGMPFRKAHAVVGEIVQTCLARNVSLNEVPLREYKKFSGLFGKDVYDILDVRASLRLKNSSGSTSPKEVAKAIRRWDKKL
jgi:argininosuccinate lyase